MNLRSSKNILLLSSGVPKSTSVLNAAGKSYANLRACLNFDPAIRDRYSSLCSAITSAFLVLTRSIIVLTVCSSKDNSSRDGVMSNSPNSNLKNTCSRSCFRALYLIPGVLSNGYTIFP